MAYELDYKESTTTASSISTTVGNDAWSGLSVTVTVGTRPIKIEAWCGGASNSVAGSGGTFSIYEGTTRLTGTSFTGSGANEVSGALLAVCRLAPSAGSHTYLVKINAVSSGTASFDAAAAAGNSFWGPAFILVTEL